MASSAAEQAERTDSSLIPDTPEASRDALISVGLGLLSQCIDLLALLEDDQLSVESKLSPGSTIGKHLRHLADHFKLLLDAVAKATANESNVASQIQLTYDKRIRNLPMETSTQAAVQELRSLKSRLRSDGAECNLERTIDLEATTPFVVHVDTSFGRELWFASLHAIHHMAIIRVIAMNELQLGVPAKFGFAPSTLLFKEAQASTKPSEKL